MTVPLEEGDGKPNVAPSSAEPSSAEPSSAAPKKKYDLTAERMKEAQRQLQIDQEKPSGTEAGPQGVPQTPLSMGVMGAAGIPLPMVGRGLPMGVAGFLPPMHGMGAAGIPFPLPGMGTPMGVAGTPLPMPGMGAAGVPLPMPGMGTPMGPIPRGR